MAEGARNVTGQTGSTCAETGPYRSSGSTKVVVFFKQGETFLSGPDGASTTWVLVTNEAG